MLEAIKMYFLPSILNSFTVIYIVSKIFNISIRSILKRKCILICFILLLMFNYIFVSGFFKFITSTVIIISYFYFFKRKSISKIVIASIIEQLIMFLSELLYFLFIIKIFKKIDFIFNDYFAIFISNIIICMISLVIIITNYKYIIKMFNFINKMEESSKYFLIFMFIIILNVLLFYIYLNYANNFSIIFNLFLIFFYFALLGVLLNEKSKNILFKEKNQMLIENLNDYEKMLDYQRVNNHENKNQLLVIKSMVEKNNSSVIEYIDEIIKEKREDNEDIYNKAKRIPSGGLQGLIYQKMLLMQDKNIDVNLDINSKVRKIDFGKLSSKMNYDICRIVGIIIDNAIEEAVKFNKKEREIIISMYVDEQFVIEVSNRIKDDLDLNKIYDKGFTSKAKGHGYGLSLLKKIVDENENIINEVKIINSIFTQIIKIKM